MNDSNPKNHWSSLADDLGAAPEPETPPIPEDEQTPAENPPDDASALTDNATGETSDSAPEPATESSVSPSASSSPAHQRPEPPPSDWGALADNLGLPPTPETPTPET